MSRAADPPIPLNPRRRFIHPSVRLFFFAVVAGGGGGGGGGAAAADIQSTLDARGPGVELDRPRFP